MKPTKHPQQTTSGTTWRRRRLARAAAGALATVISIGGVASLSGTSGAATKPAPIAVKVVVAEPNPGPMPSMMSTGWGD